MTNETIKTRLDDIDARIMYLEIEEEGNDIHDRVCSIAAELRPICDEVYAMTDRDTPEWQELDDMIGDLTTTLLENGLTDEEYSWIFEA